MIGHAVWGMIAVGMALGNRLDSRNVQVGMRFATMGVACILGLAGVAACGGDDETASTSSQSSAASRTPPEESSPNSAADTRTTIPRQATTSPTVPSPATDRAECETVEQLGIGEQGCVEILSGAVYLGDELFIADPPIVPYPGREWLRSDFPEHWTVSILNDAPVDGESWIIHDLVARRIDEDTLRVTDVNERFIADLTRDPTPINERIVAG